jgi:hypothetical protein
MKGFIHNPRKVKMKAPVRYVSVDLGYGPLEVWTRAKVIASEMVGSLFNNEQREDLLVEIPGGERVWVSNWKED